jgi:transcriptional regulator with GAF, ATPase, and Fis domain
MMRQADAVRDERGTVEESQELATLDAIVTRHIEAALRLAGGRIEGRRGAAAKLGINPHTLRARMRKLGIDWTRFRTPSASPGGGV